MNEREKYENTFEQKKMEEFGDMKEERNIYIYPHMWNLTYGLRLDYNFNLFQIIGKLHISLPFIKEFSFAH